MVFDKVKHIIADKLGISEGEIKMETTFEDLGADSLDIVELIMAIEEEYDIQVSDEEAERAQSVGDVVNYINTLVGEE
ncbi:acyl carrier protein [Proteiniclasticum sp. QWL-01]|uniref:acyl carrier protein n=1 Tax=Proteiniclasticum sp. QWL-01 TaxID=3036945 RepID=UPI0022068EBA|nr:acyl carrier protein [Proteiniclasticum sp. QWL-01]UUM12701.1 acyl carrier protein [Clostridiaceae bacterium HFYG-1003]WFF74252.1 acyl carrier protein [Proteiniclasticum sp. QWL-01]